MPAFDQQFIKLSPGTKSRLTALRDELAKDKQRLVTYDEATEYLLDLRDARAELVKGADR